MVVRSLENLENLEKSGKNKMVRENLENLEKSGNFFLSNPNYHFSIFFAWLLSMGIFRPSFSKKAYCFLIHLVYPALFITDLLPLMYSGYHFV